MTIRRQKLFFWPALAAAAIPTGFQMVQSSNLDEEQERRNQKEVKALNRLAKAAEQNPAIAQQVAGNAINIKQKESSQTGSILKGIQKEFAGVNSQTLNTAKGFLKDMGKFAFSKKDQIAKGLMGGAAIAGAGYVADRAIQHDIKKNNLPFLENQQKQYSGGNIVQQATEQVANKPGIGKRALNFGKRIAKSEWKSAAGWGIGLGAAMPTMGYLAEKKQYQDMVGSTSPQQKQYAAVNGASIMNGLKAGWGKVKGAPASVGRFWKNAYKTKGGNVLEGVAGFSGQKGADLATDISKIGQESGNKLTQTVGDFLTKHNKTASVAGIGIGAGIMSAGFGQGEKLTKKGLEAVDKNAYAYQKSKEQQVPQQ